MAGKKAVGTKARAKGLAKSKAAGNVRPGSSRKLAATKKGPAAKKGGPGAKENASTKKKPKGREECYLVYRLEQDDDMSCPPGPLDSRVFRSREGAVAFVDKLAKELYSPGFATYGDMAEWVYDARDKWRNSSYLGLKQKVHDDVARNGESKCWKRREWSDEDLTAAEKRRKEKDPAAWEPQYSEDIPRSYKEYVKCFGNKACNEKGPLLGKSGPGFTIPFCIGGESSAVGIGEHCVFVCKLQLGE